MSIKGTNLQLLKTIDNVQYVLVPVKDLDKINEISVYIHSIEKLKKCARECAALSHLKKLVGGKNVKSTDTTC